MAAQEDKDSPGIVSAAKEGEEFQGTIEEKQEQIRALVTEEYKKSFASSNEKTTTRVLGFGPSGCERKVERQNIVEGVPLTEKCDVNGDDGDKEMYILEHEMRRSGIHERRVPYGQVSAERGASKEKPIVKAHVANEDSVSDNLLEVKKKMLLEELEAVVLPGGEFAGEKVAGCKVHQDFPIPRSLGIEVIDDTALIETIPASAIGKKVDVVGYRKCTGKDAINEIEVKNGKRSRRKAKGGKNALGMDGKNKSVTRVDEARNLSGDRKDETKRKYSRKEIEAVRFVNMAEQRKVWKGIYSGLNTAVAKEYDNLASSEHQKHIRLNYDPQQCFAKKKEAPAILSAVSVCCENMDGKLHQMDSNENVNPMDPSCSRSLDEDGCTVLEGECSEDGDSEDDYDSIQKPAFMVEGIPNFDSGPPEDGWEYLRRVRWEAAQIPKVKVAKLDRSKLNKEQSDYMPKIPDIAKCPEHLLPLKRWEDAFLAEFSELRENLSQLEGSSVIRSRILQPVTPQLEEALLLNHRSLEEPVDQLILTADNKDTSSSLPLLSTILGMDSVARVSMLQKQIRLLDLADTISRNDCIWLFALCAMVDAPLDANTCSSLRSLLRKCASLRATKTELDDQVVMLNILAAISGRYFGQAED